MESVNYFLGEGKYTKRDNLLKKELKKILKIKERKSSWGKISFYLKHNLTYHKFQARTFRGRTALEIIKSGFSTGCCDYGIVFCAFARELGIPTKYIETLNKENIKNKPKQVRGHIFVEMFINDKWRIYEPKTGFLEKKGFWLSDERYLKVGEGLDFGLLKTSKGKKIVLDTSLKIKRFRNSL